MASSQQTLGENWKVSPLWDQDKGQTKGFTRSMQNSLNAAVLEIGGGQAVNHVNIQLSEKMWNLDYLLSQTFQIRYIQSVFDWKYTMLWQQK